MAFPIKQENYNKAPTAEQVKVFVEAWHMNRQEIPPTRIEAHFKIREMLGFGWERPTSHQISSSNIRKSQLDTWRLARKVKRQMRREALAAIVLPQPVHAR